MHTISGFTRLCAQHVLNASWALPDDLKFFLSGSCQDLLTRIFVRDPAQRLSMAAVMAHPWFNANLTPSAAS